MFSLLSFSYKAGTRQSSTDEHLWRPQRRSRIVAQEAFKSLADIDGRIGGIVQDVLQLFFAEIACRVPAIAFEVHSAFGGEYDALRLQQLAHPPALPECLAARELALAIDNALRWYSIRRFAHEPGYHARSTGIAECSGDPAIGCDATCRTGLDEGEGLSHKCTGLIV